MDHNSLQTRGVITVLEIMTQGVSSAREVVESLLRKDGETLDTKDGISLISMKHQILLHYLQCLVLTSAHRLTGQSLTDRSSPSESFGSLDRSSRGVASGDLVDSMVESRVALEKIKVLESKLRYQVEKLTRLAGEASNIVNNVVDDPLAFRPNPYNLLNDENQDEDDRDGALHRNEAQDEIYRPPRLNPVPYTEATRDRKVHSGPVPTAVSSFMQHDASRPFMESTSGLGGGPSLETHRARDIKRMTEFEEENFMRLVMKKRDLKRRKLDEADIALGGTGGVRGRRQGGLEDEFTDVLKSVGRSRTGSLGDGYEDLRRRGRKDGVLARSRIRTPGDADEIVRSDDPPQRKRSRFEKEAQSVKRKSLSSQKRQP